MSAAAQSLSRLGAIAAATFREAIRMKLFLLLGLVAVGSLAAGFLFRDFNLGASELRFIADFGFGGMTLFGSLVAVVVTAQLLYGEFENRTVMTLLSKPVSRAEFLVGKLIGIWLTIICFLAVLALSLCLALWARELQLAGTANGAEGAAETGVSYGGVWAFALLQCGRLAILASATAFFCSYATSGLFALFMGLFFWILGQLQSLAASQIAAAESWISAAAMRLLTVAVPNLRAFDVGETLLQGLSVGGSRYAELFLYAALYAALYSSFAVMILRKREL